MKSEVLLNLYYKKRVAEFILVIVTVASSREQQIQSRPSMTCSEQS